MPNPNLNEIDQHQNEPKMRPGAKGFLSVPSVGMRLAPEILVLEMFRDVFYSEDRDRQMQTRELTPDLRDSDNRPVFSPAERAVIWALQGRRKQTRRSREGVFFAPAYPELARESWLSKRRERIIVRLLFEGAISQHFWSRGEQVENKVLEHQDAVDTIVSALIGTQKRVDDGLQQDILRAALSTQDTELDHDQARRTLFSLTRLSATVFETESDELADRIVDDFLALCELEKNLPRLIWLRIVMSYLRFALPMWLLAHMRITCLVHGFMIKAVGGSALPRQDQIMSAIGERNRNIIRPTLTPTRELFSRIREYIRCRVELNVLLYCLENIRPENLNGLTITTAKVGAGLIPLADFLSVARSAGDDLRASQAYDHAPSLPIFLTRSSEMFRAWRDPLNKGQGRNIDEFLRVLYQAESGDEAGGYLLIGKGRGETRGFRVFPGPLLLQTIAFLAARAKQAGRPDTLAGGGKLVLEDIQEHFAQYGIDFSEASDALPLLMNELQALGLLAGSPDAGSSVAVTCPF